MGSNSENRMVGQDQLVGTESRAKRDRAGSAKPQLSLVLEFKKALEGAARGLAEGVDKYGRGDWKKGFPATEICDSLANHLTAYLSGELIDPDSKNGATHIEKILCNALLLAELHNQPHADRDENGFSLRTGFNEHGLHISHDRNDALCNCPSCR
jgi:hypothetical protein